MMVRKFYAPTSREALRLVRQALGDEAMILDNRKTPTGVEVMAVAESEIKALTASTPPGAFRKFEPQGANGMPGGAAEGAPSRPAVTPSNPFATAASAYAIAPSVAASAAGTGAWPGATRQASAKASAPAASMLAASAGTASASQPGGFDVVHELRLLRSLMEEQVAALAWNDLRRREPARSTSLRKMLSAGFSVGLARKLMDRMPEGADENRGMRWTKAALQAMLNVIPEERNIIAQGGIFALVGPTGVGKTTTVAKLAAQATLRFGAEHVALITTDTYRIGAVDQLRVYAKILGVPVVAIRDENEMRTAIADLKSRRIVLIDTIGMGQRDRRLVDQVALLCGNGKPVRRLLLLSAVAQPNVLAEVVEAYKGPALSGCILTKLDESLTLGGALDVLIRHKLPLYYVTNGQRVPEDLHLASPLYLVERAIRLAPETGSFAFAEEDVPYLFAESAAHTSQSLVSGAMSG